MFSFVFLLFCFRYVAYGPLIGVAMKPRLPVFTSVGVRLQDVGCRMASSMGCLRAEAATDKAAVLADVDPMIGVSTVIPRRGTHGASSLSS